MAFTLKDPKDTYLAILNIGDANDSLQAIATKVVRDAAGLASLLELSQSVVAFTGIMTANVANGMVFDPGVSITADSLVTDGLLDKTDNDVGVFFTAGNPEGALSAGIGSIALRRDGSSGATAYVKESGVGNTGWTPFDLYSTFLDLLDTPAVYTAGKWLKVNGAGTALELTDPPTVALGLFTDLSDTPPSYAGFGGKVVKVDVAEAGLTFGDPPASTFLDLTDTPGAYTPDKLLKVNAGGTAIEFGDPPAGTFIDHPDTPASYVGSAGYRVKVNGTPDALTFVADTFLNLSDTPGVYAANQWVKVNAGGTALEFVSSPAISFVGLTDTPASYVGAAGAFVAVNASADGLAFIGSGANQGEIMYFNGTAWTALAVGTAGQVLTTNGAAANPSWEDTAGTFVGLTDTPADYTGVAGYRLRVNSTPDGVEFIDDSFLTLNDTPAAYPADSAFGFAHVNATEDGLEFPGNPLYEAAMYAPFTPIGIMAYIDADSGIWAPIPPPPPAGDPPPRMYLMMDPSNDPNTIPGGPGIIGGFPFWDIITIYVGEVQGNFIGGVADYTLPYALNAVDPFSAELQYMSLVDMLVSTDFVPAAPTDGQALIYTIANGVEWGTAGGGGGAKYYDTVQEPVTNGNPVTPEILFDSSGDVIMIATTTEYTTH
jgi:hypothetical protein